jgi:DNA-binding beta-propeller fold protein YncE
MRRFLVAGAFLASAASAALATPPQQMLPTGQALTPTAAPAATYTPLVANVGPNPSYVADGASAIAVSPDKREMLVLTSGFNKYNGSDGKLLPTQSTQYIFRYAISGPRAEWLQTLQVPNSFGGIGWVPDGSAFLVGGGMDDALYVFARRGAAFEATGKIALGHKAGFGPDVLPQTAGVAVSPDGRLALVANYYNDSVSLVDLGRQAIIAEQDLRPGKIDPSQSGVPGGEFPFAIAWSDAGHAWVSSPRDRELVQLSIAGNAVRVVSRVKTIGEPTALLAAANGWLFATEDNADRLAVVDLKTAKLIMDSRLTLPKQLGAPPLGKGLNPNGLAMTPQQRLLVTLGGINAVGLISPTPSGPAIESLIPTGWYPSAIATNANGTRVYVANRKSPPGPNPLGCKPALAKYRGQPNACGAANQYIWQLEKAGVVEFPMPDEQTLASTTLQVASNLGLPNAAERTAAMRRMAPIARRIKHVVFIIKENRTYDQVLGDLDVGNGDPHLAILGKDLSPNHHRLARQFVTLDNFYDSGEVSAAGWSWSTAARATDMLEKSVPVTYADRGLSYESEEILRNIHPQQTMAERYATDPTLSKDPDLLPGPALLTAPDPDEDDKPDQGYLWDAAIRAGLTVRNYGFSDASNYDPAAPGGKPLIREPFKEHRPIYTAGDRLLASRSDPYYRGFDLKLPDFWREREWEREYGRQEASGTLPALTLLRMGNDHFGDFDNAIDGVNTVETQMADNDFAIGKVVERIARGKAAKSTLIFIVEDDAQNGTDHVDARRAPAFVIGPFVRHNAVVSTRYTTLNVLRTIEAVLGLKPLGLNDGLATPMADLFDATQSQWSYRAEAASVLRSTKLPIPPDRFVPTEERASLQCVGHTAGYWAAAMKGQDFSKEDRLDTAAFNSALWRGLGRGAEPSTRDGRDLSRERSSTIAGIPPAPCAS